jgi:hypothetical protein
MVVHYGKKVYAGSMRKLSTPTKLEYFDSCHYIIASKLKTAVTPNPCSHHF